MILTFIIIRLFDLWADPPKKSRKRQYSYYHGTLSDYRSHTRISDKWLMRLIVIPIASIFLVYGIYRLHDVSITGSFSSLANGVSFLLSSTITIFYSWIFFKISSDDSIFIFILWFLQFITSLLMLNCSQLDNLLGYILFALLVVANIFLRLNFFIQCIRSTHS